MPFTLDNVVLWKRNLEEYVRMFAMNAFLYVQSVVNEFRRAGYQVEIEEVDYEFQRGVNAMMGIRDNARGGMAYDTIDPN